MGELTKAEEAIYGLKGILADYEGGADLGQAGYNSAHQALFYIDSLESENKLLKIEKLEAQSERDELREALEKARHWLEGWGSAETELEFIEQVLPKGK